MLNVNCSPAERHNSYYLQFPTCCEHDAFYIWCILPLLRVSIFISVYRKWCMMSFKANFTKHVDMSPGFELTWHKTQMCRLCQCLKRQTKLLVNVNTGLYLPDWFCTGLLMVPAVWFYEHKHKIPMPLLQHRCDRQIPPSELFNTFVKKLFIKNPEFYIFFSMSVFSFLISIIFWESC